MNILYIVYKDVLAHFMLWVFSPDLLYNNIYSISVHVRFVIPIGIILYVIPNKFVNIYFYFSTCIYTIQPIMMK